MASSKEKIRAVAELWLQMGGGSEGFWNLKEVIAVEIERLEEIRWLKNS